MARKRKGSAGQTHTGPVRSKEKHKRVIRFSYARARSVLFRHFKSKYPTWESTKHDARAILNELKAAGYKKATKKSIIKNASEKRRHELEVKRAEQRPTENVSLFFTNHPQMLEPIPFYQVEYDLCIPWGEISNKLYLWTKSIWPKEIVYQGGKTIPYEEAFGNYSRQMARLQSMVRNKGQDYTTDWFFKLKWETAEWNDKQKVYYIEVVTSESYGIKKMYLGEKEEEMPKGPPEKGVEKPEEALPPEKPTPPEPEPIPPAPGKPAELTPEQRVEIEKEKVRAEAAAKSEAKVKVAEKYSELFERGKLTFEQYEKLMGNLFL